MEQEIRKLLLTLGIRSTYLGFRYLEYALSLCMKSETYLMAVYKALYVDVAKQFQTKPGNVEHCLRTVISNCWNHGNREYLVNLSNYPLRTKPTNGEFIDILYHALMHP